MSLSHCSCLPHVNSTILLIFLFFSDYSQGPANSNNLIGLNRTRRRHNAVFVSFTDPTVPTKCLEGAMTNWIQVCQKDHDKQAEEQLRKVCDCNAGSFFLFCFFILKFYSCSL